MIKRMEIELKDGRTFYIYPNNVYDDLADLTDERGNNAEDIPGLSFDDATQQVIVPAVQMLANTSRNLTQLEEFNRATRIIAAES